MSGDEEVLDEFSMRDSISQVEYMVGAYHTRKQGLALKNRLHGNAEKHRRLLDRDVPKAEDQVKYFRDKLRPHFVEGAHSVILWRFYLFIRARRRNTETVDWIGNFVLLLKRAKDSWMDMLPLSSMTEQQRQAQYQADMTRSKTERQGRNEAALDQNQPRTRDNWYAICDNLATWMLIVGSDQNEAQRERLTSSLSLRNITVTA